MLVFYNLSISRFIWWRWFILVDVLLEGIWVRLFKRVAVPYRWVDKGTLDQISAGLGLNAAVTGHGSLTETELKDVINKFDGVTGSEAGNKHALAFLIHAIQKLTDPGDAGFDTKRDKCVAYLEESYG